MPLVYLAGPIANLSTRRARGWRKAIASDLVSQCDESLAVFDPASGFSVNSRITDGDVTRIQQVDDAALVQSDVVLVQMIRGIISNGTDHEVSLAIVAKKPIVVYAIGWTPNELEAMLSMTYGVEVASRLRIEFTRHGVVAACLEALDDCHA